MKAFLLIATIIGTAAMLAISQATCGGFEVHFWGYPNHSGVWRHLFHGLCAVTAACFTGWAVLMARSATPAVEDRAGAGCIVGGIAWALFCVLIARLLPGL